MQNFGGGGDTKWHTKTVTKNECTLNKNNVMHDLFFFGSMLVQGGQNNANVDIAARHIGRICLVECRRVVGIFRINLHSKLAAFGQGDFLQSSIIQATIVL